ncbi:MAG: hypothetical protein JXR78_01840 [Victivallales bacterium]|nr:hypothetical protein [Victivallales bacterium]
MKRREDTVLIAVRIPIKMREMIKSIAQRDGVNESIVIRQELKKNLSKRYSKV